MTSGRPRRVSLSSSSFFPRVSPPSFAGGGARAAKEAHIAVASAPQGSSLLFFFFSTEILHPQAERPLGADREGDVAVFGPSLSPLFSQYPASARIERKEGTKREGHAAALSSLFSFPISPSCPVTISVSAKERNEEAQTRGPLLFLGPPLFFFETRPAPAERLRRSPPPSIPYSTALPLRRGKKGGKGKKRLYLQSPSLSSFFSSIFSAAITVSRLPGEEHAVRA